MVASLLSSCSNETNNLDLTGQPIVFGATVERQEPKTKTSFAGPDGVFDGIERIDWVPEKDKILINMYSDDGNGGETQTPIPSQEYVIKGETTPQGYVSIAPTEASNPLTWRGNNIQHRFTGIYPSSYGGTYTDGGRWNNSLVEFMLPDVQDGSMDYAYMAAISKYYEAGENVTLQFSPVVTTLYIQLHNDTESDYYVDKIILSNKGNGETQLTGTFKVDLNYNSDPKVSPQVWNWQNKKNTITVNVQKDVNQTGTLNVPIFLGPRDHNASDIEIAIYLSNKQLSTTKLLSNKFSGRGVSTFVSCKKYNVPINLSGEGTIEPEPEIPIDPPTVTADDALAQFMLSVLNPTNGAETMWAFAESYFREYFKFESEDPDLLNFFKNTLTPLIDSPLEGLYDRMKEAFPGDKMTGLMNFMSSLKEVNITNSNLPKISSDTLDLSLFVNAKKISFIPTKNMSVSITGPNKLESFVNPGDTDTKMKLYFRDCDNLKTIDIKVNASLEELHLIRTYRFQEANVSRSDRDVSLIYLEDCSTYVTTNATINLNGNQNNDPVIKRNGNTDKVTVYWDNGKKKDPK